MARRRNGSNRRSRRSNGRSMTLPVAVLAGFAPLAINTLRASGGWDRKLWMATQALTGYDTDTGVWWWPNLKKGAIPIGIGFAVHWLLGQKLGLNRALSRAGIPLIRI